MTDAAGLPPRATVTEVGPRDGLQNEAAILPTEAKVSFVDALALSGLREIEITSFVSSRWVPQLADAEEVSRRVTPREGVLFSALVPNEQGLERALACGVKKVSVFTAVSETFCRKNTNATVAETLVRFLPVIEGAKRAGLAVRGYLSTAFGCPFEGPEDPRKVARVARELLSLGCDEISVGDTIGVATPRRVREGLLALRDAGIPPERTALHFHDTRGTALANCLVSLQEGYSSFDASAGGLGGCPYAPGAAGNLATEDLLYLLAGLGVETGIDMERVREAGRGMEAVLGRPLPGKVFKAGGAPWEAMCKVPFTGP